MSNILYTMKKLLSETWSIYLNVLIKADQMLQEKKDYFQEVLLRDQELLKREIKEFGKTWEDYKKSASNNDKLTSSGSYKTLSYHRLLYIQIFFYIC